MTLPQRVRNTVVAAAARFADAVDRRRAAVAASAEAAAVAERQLTAATETRQMVASGHEAAERQSDAAVRAIADVAATLNLRTKEIGGRLDAQSDGLRERLEQLGGDLSALSARLQDVEDRLMDAQALVARVYDTAEDGPGKLHTMRAGPEYEDAWTDFQPLVSIRIATYNRSEILCERALASVLRQTHTNWECIVVGDALTDDTAERIAALGDSRIRFVNLPYRGPYPEDAKRRWFVAGIPPANRALQEAAGRWIAPLDDDDEWDDDHLEVLLDEARRTHAELVYGRLRVLEVATGKLLSHEVGVWPPIFGQFTLQAAIQHAGLTAFELDPNAVHAGEPGDWNLGRRLWEAGVRFAYVDRAVATYHWMPVNDPARPPARD